MAVFVQFRTYEDTEVLIEVAEEVVTPEGVKKAGLRDRFNNSIAVAATAYEDFIGAAIRLNADALMNSLKRLDDPPDEAEITFGLKVTAELGNWAIAKGAGESNYTVRLAWTRTGGQSDDR